MLNRKRNRKITAIIFLMFFLSLTLFGGSGVNLSIMGAYPLLFLSLLVAFSGYTSVFPSAMTGLACGIVLDSVELDSCCFNALCLMLLAVLSNLLAERVFNRNLKATVFLCLLISSVYYLFYWLFFMAFGLSFNSSIEYLLQIALPSSVYTAATIIPFYYIFKYFKKLKSQNQ